MTPANVHLIAAVRPNFMKVAPLFHVLKRAPWCSLRLIHTGQHYDANMSDRFFDDLGLPAPHAHLRVGSGSHAEQTAGVMIAYERLCLEHRPDWVVVVGDVNSTLACALVCAKLRIPVAHLEAGLRSGDRAMPEEINRIVTDAVADLLWTPSADADDNLRAQGIAPGRIERVGNIMIDSFELLRERIAAAGTAAGLGVDPGGYGVVTLHRPANVDDPRALASIVEQLAVAAGEIDLVFSLHPRTRSRLQAFGLETALAAPGLTVIEPLGYIEFMNLVQDARLVITDSGGVQEETTYLGIPCLTLRDTTERPITVERGTNRLVATAELLDRTRQAAAGRWPEGERIPLWDGRTAERAAASLARVLGA
jgi:UDP-N-acetylglucosamine 2-epimerase (non-hydrolysing)